MKGLKSLENLSNINLVQLFKVWESIMSIAALPPTWDHPATQASFHGCWQILDSLNLLKHPLAVAQRQIKSHIINLR